jgi:hypothetical protein
VIGATVWRYAGSSHIDVALAQLGAALFTSNDPAPSSGICIADSKRLYAPGRGLARLESCLLAALASCGHSLSSWRDVWARLAPASIEHLDADPIYACFAADSPGHCARMEIDSLRAALLAALAKCEWQLVGVHCRAVFPGEFNASIECLGNKANVLSQSTLELAAQALAALPPGDAVVCCDKHGGRNRYTSVLQHCFPDGWVTPRRESAAESLYDCRLGDRSIRFEFRAGGESLPPTALASMAAKYLRELAMQAFNAFWAGHVADLRPTAGYPSDAKRFHDDVRSARQTLGIAEEVFWRTR